MLESERAVDPGALAIVIAEAGPTVACAAWIRFERDTEFATLWGGAGVVAVQLRAPPWRPSGRDVHARAREVSRPLAGLIGLTQTLAPQLLDQPVSGRSWQPRSCSPGPTTAAWSARPRYSLARRVLLAEQLATGAPADAAVGEPEAVAQRAAFPIYDNMDWEDRKSVV